MFGRSRLGPPSSLNGYVLIVAVAGLAVLAAAAAQGCATFAHPSLALWVLVAMALVTEVTPLSDHPLLPYVQSSSTSTPFVIAVLAQWGGAPAVIVGAASSLLGDVVHRRPGRKTIFNLAQYSLMYGAMAGVYHALGASPPFELRWRQVLTLVLAGAAGELVNLGRPSWSACSIHPPIHAAACSGSSVSRRAPGRASSASPWWCWSSRSARRCSRSCWCWRCCRSTPRSGRRPTRRRGAPRPRRPEVRRRRRVGRPSRSPRSGPGSSTRATS